MSGPLGSIRPIDLELACARQEDVRHNENVEPSTLTEKLANRARQSRWIQRVTQARDDPHNDQTRALLRDLVAADRGKLEEEPANPVRMDHTPIGKMEALEHPPFDRPDCREGSAAAARVLTPHGDIA